jgi:transposase
MTQTKMCPRCQERPRKSTLWYCLECHNAINRAREAVKKAEREKLKLSTTNKPFSSKVIEVRYEEGFLVKVLEPAFVGGW